MPETQHLTNRDSFCNRPSPRGMVIATGEHRRKAAKEAGLRQEPGFFMRALVPE